MSFPHLGRHRYYLHFLGVGLLGLCLPMLVSAEFLTFMGAENGRIYGVSSTGYLLFYWHQPEGATGGWANNSVGQSISGPQWNAKSHVLYNGSGNIYAVTTDGRLQYYRDLAQDGTSSWANNGVGIEVGLNRNWADYRWVLAGNDGIIYAVDSTGRFWFFRHITQDTNGVWANGGSGQQIGQGWSGYKRIFSGHSGVIYAIDHTGTLYYFRELARNGTVNWAHGGNALAIGTAWDKYQQVFSTGNGNLYAVDAAGNIYFFHVTITNSTAVWDPGSGTQIGSGFLPQLWTGGYAWPLSVAPGQTIAFKLSAGGAVNVALMRHHSVNTNVMSILYGYTNVVAPLQPVPDDLVRHGCGWTTTFTLTIPQTWPSGIYSARCTNSSVNFDVPFIVNPQQLSPSKVAVLANVNTWLAYNNYGWASKYNGRAHASFERPTPNASPLHGTLHLTRAELWILGWLEQEGIVPDVYSDLDFHNQRLLGGYKCLIVGTHPEYWSLEMVQNLQTFLAGGGSLLYLGGNGLFESAEYTTDQTGMVFMGGIENGPRESSLFRCLIPALPERSLLGVATEACGVTGAPYTVLRPEHPFFAGTGLRAGENIGAYGLNTGNGNGAAAGWEVDSSNGPGATGWPDSCGMGGQFAIQPGAGLPAGLVVLASATHTGDVTCTSDMTYYPHPGGGFVFSVGSITFGGSLVVDPQLQRVVRNVLTEATQPTPQLSIAFALPNNVQVGLRGRFGMSYVLQTSPSLNPGVWTNIATLSLDTGSTTTLILPASAKHNYLRAVQSP